MRRWILCILCLILLGCGAPVGSPTEAAPRPISLLMVSAGAEQGNQVISWDLATKRATPLFTPPPQGWVNQIDLAADGHTLALSYTPPPGQAGAPFDRAGLYALDLEGTDRRLTPLLVPEGPHTFYYNPIWSPDGRYLFTVRIMPKEGAPQGVQVTLMRYELESQTLLPIAEDGIWPRVSPDGQRLVYIIVNPDTLERGLRVSDLAGEEMQELIPIGEYFDLDTPLFAADSSALYVAAAAQTPPTSRRWWGGVAEAHADHNVPTEWYRVPLAGGELEQLTEQQQIVIYGALAPGGQTIYYITTAGLFALPLSSQEPLYLSEAPTYRNLTIRGGQ